MIIPEGTILQTIMTTPDADEYLRERQNIYLYDPSIEHDKNVYEGYFAYARSLRNGSVYIYYYKTTKELRIADDEDVYQIWKKLYGEYDYIINEDLETFQVNCKKHEKRTNPKILNYQIQETKDKTEDDFMITYAMMASFMNKLELKTVRMLLDEIRKEYDGIIDLHNRSAFLKTERPMIIFEPCECLCVDHQPYLLRLKDIEKSFLNIPLSVYRWDFPQLSGEEFFDMVKQNMPDWFYQMMLAKGFQESEDSYPEKAKIIPKGTILKCINNDAESEKCFYTSFMYPNKNGMIRSKKISNSKQICLFDPLNIYDSHLYRGLISAEKSKGDCNNLFREREVYEHTFVTRHNLLLPKESHKIDILSSSYGKNNENHRDFYKLLAKVYDATINDIDVLRYKAESSIVLFDPADALHIADVPHKMEQEEIIENCNYLPQWLLDTIKE